MANSVDPDQTAPRGSLFWVHAICFNTYFVSNDRQLFAADDFSRQHFQIIFLLGALRVKIEMQPNIFFFYLDISVLLLITSSFVASHQFVFFISPLGKTLISLRRMRRLFLDFVVNTVSCAA